MLYAFRHNLSAYAIRNRGNAAITCCALLPEEERDIQDHVLYIASSSQTEALIRFSAQINLACCCYVDERPVSVQRYPNANILLLKGASEPDIFVALGNQFIRENNAMDAVLLDALCHNSIEQLCRIGSLYMGNPMLIVDVGYRVIACSDMRDNSIWHDGGIIADLPDGNWQLTGEFVKSAGMQTLELSTNATAIVSPTGAKIIAAPIMLNIATMAYAFILEHNSEFVTEDLPLLEKVCKYLSIEMQKDERFKNRSGLKYEYFLVKLIENRDQNLQFIEQRANNLKIRFQNFNRVVAIQFASEADHAGCLYSILVKELRGIIGGVLSAVYRDYIVILLTSDSERGISAHQEEKLHQYLAARKMTAGISQPFCDLAQVNRYYRQAIDCIGIGDMLRLDGTVRHAQQMMLSLMFSKLSLSNDLDAYIPENVAAILDYDKKYNTTYYLTAQEYAKNNLKTISTADALHIHPNTLRYRIKKMSEIFNVGFDDAETIFQLMFGFQLVDYISKGCGNVSLFQ